MKLYTNDSYCTLFHLPKDFLSLAQINWIMKRLILVFSAITLLAGQAHSQLLNSGLEVWVKDTFETSVNVQGIQVDLTSEFNTPEDWSSSNQFTNIESDPNIITFDKSVVEKDTNSFSGTYAAKMTTKTLNTPQGQINAPGAISNGTLELDFSQGAQNFSFSNILDNVTGGNAVQARPSRLTGYYQYTPAGDDSLLISIQAKSWDSAKSESKVVGEGTFIRDDTQSTYKKFDVRVNYRSCIMPDTVLVNISGGVSPQSTPGTVMFVDSLNVDTLSSQSNFPPFANNDDTATSKGNAVTVDILNNDVDCDDPTIIKQSTQSTNQPSNGSVTIQDTTATYTPDAGFSGTDQFRYSISDNQESDTATVTVAVNSAPQAQDDAVFTVVNNSSIQVNVTNNDSDPDGDGIAVSSIATAPDSGSASVVSDDTVEYDPDDTYTGSDQFEYVLCDDASPELCDTATVQFDVVAGILDDIASSASVLSYPNPAQDQMMIDLTTDKNFNQSLELRLISTNGKIVKVEQILNGKNKIDLSNLSEGLYLFNITTDEAKLIERGKFSISR